MGYIFDLRKRIGHSPVIMPSACVLIMNKRGQLLLQKRKDNGFWGYPGGSLDLGESFEECAKREALEETGLSCNSLQYFTHSSGKDMYYKYPNGDEVYIVEMVFLCTDFSGCLQVQQTEAEEQRFFDLDNLPDNISPLNKKAINLLIEKGPLKL